MRVAIQTRYLGATARKGSRIMAKAMQSGKMLSAYVPFDNNLNVIDNHQAALTKLASRLGWYGDYVAGGTHKGYVFVCVRPVKDTEDIEAFRVIDEERYPSRNSGSITITVRGFTSWNDKRLD